MTPRAGNAFAELMRATGALVEAAKKDEKLRYLAKQAETAASDFLRLIRAEIGVEN